MKNIGRLVPIGSSEIFVKHEIPFLNNFGDLPYRKIIPPHCEAHFPAGPANASSYDALPHRIERTAFLVSRALGPILFTAALAGISAGIIHGIA